MKLIIFAIIIVPVIVLASGCKKPKPPQNPVVEPVEATQGDGCSDGAVEDAEELPDAEFDTMYDEGDGEFGSYHVECPEIPLDGSMCKKTKGICKKYCDCCVVFIDALNAVDNMPCATLQAQRTNCEGIADIQGTPGAEEECKAGFDGLKQGAEAMKAMPGFEMPDECNVE